MSTKRVRSVYQLKITLRDIDPPIWRSIQVWEDTKLPKLHRILQMLFNWEDYHLHDFVVGKRVYSVPDLEEDAFYDRKVSDEKLVPINRVVDRVGDTFVYNYDFGDDWMHDILLEAILLPEPTSFYPRCTAGARNGPPEDAGGPFGYSEYLRALADRKHPQHRDMLAWRGRFDPELFSLKKINAALHRSFGKRVAAKKTAIAADDPLVDELTTLMLRAIDGDLPIAPARRTDSGKVRGLELTAREQELLAECTILADDLPGGLPLPAHAGKSRIFWYTQTHLADLAAYVAAEANHCKHPKSRKELEQLFDKICAVRDWERVEDASPGSTSVQ